MSVLAPLFVNMVPRFDNFKNQIGFTCELGANAVIVEVKPPKVQSFENKVTKEQDEFDSFSFRILNPIDEKGNTESIFVNSADRDMEAMQATYAKLDAIIKAGKVISVAGKTIRASNKAKDGSVKTNYFFAGTGATVTPEVLANAVPTDAI